MTFRTILDAVQKESGMEDDHLAEHLNVDEKTVLLWHEGKAYPEGKVLDDFSAIFAVPKSLLEESIKETKKGI